MPRAFDRRPPDNDHDPLKGLLDFQSLNDTAKTFGTPWKKLMDGFLTLVNGLVPLINIPGLPAGQITSGSFPMSMILGLLTGFTNLYPAALMNNDGTATASSLSSAIGLNSDGTATYTKDSLTQLIFEGDGTAATVFNLIQNLGGAAGRQRSTVNTLQDVIDLGTQSLLGSTTTGYAPNDFANALKAIPADNVAGLAGIAGLGATIQDTWDQMWRAFSSSAGSNQSLSALADAAHNTAQTATSAQNQTASNAGILSAFIGARAANHGLDPTAVASYNLATNSNTALNATATVSPMSFHIIKQPTTFGNFETVATKGGSGTFTGFFLNAYRMGATGALTSVYNSPDLTSQLNTAGGWVRTGSIALANQPSFVAGEVLAIEVVQQGTGSVALRSQATGVPNHPTALLKNFGASRDPTGSLTPATITAAAVAFSANQPWISATVVNVPAGWQPPVTTRYATPGSFTYTIPSFAKVVGAKLDLIALGSGGGGQANYGTLSWWTGGNAGTWASQILVCGTDYPTTATSLTVVVGAKGLGAGVYWTNGNPGNISTVTWTDPASAPHTITGSGGAGGGNAGTSNPFGKSPGNTVVNGVTYFGGTEVGGNAAGSPPGGGGGGAGPYQTGGDGAHGSVWIVARQS